MGDMRAFYEARKAVCGPSHQIQAPLRSSDGSALLTDREAILQRLSEHFEGLFSDQCTVQESSLAKIPQVDVDLDLDDPPIREEIRKATMPPSLSVSPLSFSLSPSYLRGFCRYSGCFDIHTHKETKKCKECCFVSELVL